MVKHNSPELSDPSGHFPYKRAAVQALLDQNLPMGPDGESDDRVLTQDYTSAEIVEASAAYVAAQAEYLQDAGEGTYAMMQATAEALVSARQAHRANRATMNVVGIRSRRAGE